MTTARFTRTARTRTAATAAAVALGLTLTACASEEPQGAGGDSAAGGDETEISIGIPSGWDEGIAVSHLWKRILEEQGYTVETETADVGVVYTGLAGGDFDVTFDVWLPYTHASYEEKYGSQVTDLGVWYDDAKLTIAVNEDSPAQSLEDLAAMADEYGNKLVGIEAGAGLTQITQDEVVPTYGLEGMEYAISSTPAMLAELKGATDAGENIAVTLWRPHWAYDEFPIRDLEDPQGALGDAEEIHIWGAADFEERYPQLTEWLAGFTLTDEQLFSLENTMFNDPQYADDPEAAVDAWLEDNQDLLEDLGI
ncbi:glycine betaine ABC transporter substrate-binding protein [Isoptericola variabilis]|uniref:ABC-type glycine betaine transport, periplasmic subunit n=1 Tax=Isoptericola variabilis (strain 225) TaxID=743718 RepID=F6FRN0_ISOV2|nr:glycine betaine ABC transporter substrate-binding protein [Isoptericola variabilis]AEG45088.1 ABC-type glycine betaine transport, periplasmic subunit [Isoptericola variabilis 225]TWH26218.1 glycine betaine/proline transport system substrate-binding protein [Isoptericola variabilis J7]